MASKGIKVDLDVAGAVSATGNVSGQNLVSTNSNPDEGGEIQLSLPSSGSTLSTGVTIDVYQNKLRIFETGGDNQGAYIDLSTASAGVGSNLLAGGGSGITDVVQDTTPQLGGDLDAQGNNITNVEYVGLDTTPASEPSAAGSLWWSQDFETLNVKLDSAVTLQVGQEHVIRVKNASGTTAIPNRTVVMFAGATGDTVTVSPADSSDVFTIPSDYLVGVTTEEIPADGFGFVTQFGFINQVDTNAWAVGTLLYSDPANDGGITSTQPAAPAWQKPIGAVTRQSETSGRILVRALPGVAIKNLEGTSIDTTPADNELLAYNSGTGTWINQTYNEAGLNKVYYQTSEPSSPAVGDVWVDSDGSVSGGTVPLGGTSGQLLYKNSSTDYDTFWGDTPGIESLSNVNIPATPDNAELLTYDSSTSKWINRTASEASIIDGVSPQNMASKYILNPRIYGAMEGFTTSATTSGTYNADLATSGGSAGIYYLTANQTANRTINFRGSSSQTLTSLIGSTNNQSLTAVVLVTNGATPYYISTVQVDGSTKTPKWLGGTAPTSGNANSVDIYTFTMVFISGSWEVFASVARYA